MIRRLDIEIYSEDNEWAQGRYLVHGHDDVFWTDDAEDVLEFLRYSLEKEHDGEEGDVSEKPNIAIDKLKQKVKEIQKEDKSSKNLAFALNDKEMELANVFKDKHTCPKRYKDSGAIGGQYTYSFICTGIGDFVEITCSCGASMDITDNDTL